MIQKRIPEHDAAVWYYSTWEAVNFIPDNDLWREAVTDIMNFMYFNDEPKSKNPMVHIILTQAIPTINKARVRHDNAVKTGEKGKEFGVEGGRPKEYDDNEIVELRLAGMTQQTIADKLNCSLETVKRALRKYNQSCADVGEQNRTKPLKMDVEKELYTDEETEKNIYIERKNQKDIDSKRENHIDEDGWGLAGYNKDGTPYYRRVVGLDDNSNDVYQYKDWIDNEEDEDDENMPF